MKRCLSVDVGFIQIGPSYHQGLNDVLVPYLESRVKRREPKPVFRVRSRTVCQMPTNLIQLLIQDRVVKAGRAELVGGQSGHFQDNAKLFRTAVQ